jgi:hypothetical protein
MLFLLATHLERRLLYLNDKDYKPIFRPPMMVLT